MSLMKTNEEQLNRKHQLYIFTNRVDWGKFEKEFLKHNNEKMGKHTRPIRLMTGLLILKHLMNLRDETVVE